MAFPYGIVSTAATSKPLVATFDATIDSNTAISLNEATTGIEVSAVAQGIFMRWDGTASSSAFDGYISPGTTKVFMRPRGTTTVNFIQQAATANLVCIEF